MTDIPFLNLKAQYKEHKSEIDEAITRVVDNQYFILGNELKTFETNFASYLGVKYACGVNSGTDALVLALKVLGIGRGDEVITPTLSFIATTLAITEVGATPVFVDSDTDTYQIDVSLIEKKITSKTKAIIPVHLYGAPCEIDKIMEIANRHSLRVIEDACQAHGTLYKSQMAGTFGDIGVYSFYPGKNLGCYGDGGAMVTNDEEIYKKMISIRNYGQTVKYHHETLGVNSRLDEIQAAILDVKLKHLDGWNDKRRVIAKKYNKEIKRLKTQRIISNGISNYHVFSVIIEERDNFIKELDNQGIKTIIHYPIPIHLQNCYSSLGYAEGSFPVAEKIAKSIVSLPMYPELNISDQEVIIKTINNLNV
jgi:dTDP-4-amino-4,6-dideoxygalactose transaminase